MTNRGYDAAIVGGGIAGVTIFHELVCRGWNTILIDRNDGVGQGASFANGGLLTASMPDPWNGPGVAKHLFASLFDSKAAMKIHPHMLPSLAFWGLRFLRNSTSTRHREAILANYSLANYSVRETVRFAANFLPQGDVLPSGALKIFEDEEPLKAQRDMARLLVPHGLKFEELSRDDVVRLEPNLATASERIKGAIYFPDDLSGDAYGFCQAALKDAVSKGGQFLASTPVKSLRAANGRISGVETEQGVIEANAVVLAAGEASPDLARKLGVSLPIKPAKGYSVTLEAKGINDGPRIPVVDDAMHAAITPLAGQLRAVGTAEFAGRDSRISKPRTDNLLDLFDRLYPHLSDKIDRESGTAWAGFRPMSADGKPFIGPTKIVGLWANTGHGHLGWTMAVGSARLLGALMSREKPPISAAPFDPNR